MAKSKKTAANGGTGVAANGKSGELVLGGSTGGTAESISAGYPDPDGEDTVFGEEHTEFDRPYVPPKYDVKKQDGTEELFSVNGVSIRRNSSYQIVGLRDDTAPAALRDRETSKFPTPDVREDKTMPYDTVTNTYDTGFFEGSACYRGKDADYVRSEVKRRNENLKAPYEKIVGEGKLNQNYFEFWDNYNASLYLGKVFFTSDINQLFELYTVMQGRYAMPRELEGSPDYPNAMYCIVDKDKAVNVAERRNTERAEAIQLFSNALEGNRKRLLYVLRWIGFDYTEGTGNSRLLSDFYGFVNDAGDINRAEVFLEAIRKSQSKEGFETYRMYSLLDEMQQRQQIRRTETGYYLENYDLGVDLKAAAVRMVNDTAFTEVKFRLLTLAGEKM
jgi:hypothetical protein